MLQIDCGLQSKEIITLYTYVFVIDLQATEIGGSRYQHVMSFAAVPSTPLHKAAFVERSFTHY